MKRVYVNNEVVLLRLLYSEERIAAEVQRLAAEITAAYAGQELVVVVVLKGAFFFATDLVRQIGLPLAIDFVRMKSYSGTTTTGKVSLTMSAEIDLQGANVLVVEDIVDTGLSLAFLFKEFKGRGAKGIRVCALIDKPSSREHDVSVDYSGMVYNGGFLVGYGLDINECCRELPAIYEIMENSR